MTVSSRHETASNGHPSAVWIDQTFNSGNFYAHAQPDAEYFRGKYYPLWNAIDSRAGRVYVSATKHGLDGQRFVHQGD